MASTPMQPATSNPEPARKSRVGSAIGPAFITAALVFGPGSVTTASAMGAKFSYDLLWVPVIATMLMLAFVDIGVRIGLTTDAGPIGTLARKTGRVLAVIIALGTVMVTASFQAGNSVGTGAAANVLFNADTRVWTAVFTAAALVFVWLPGYYAKLEKLMVGIVIIMLLAFLLTAIVSKPDLGAAVLGMLLPSLPQDSSALVVGAVATTFSVAGAFYQIQLVRQKGWSRDQYQQARRDAALGSIILGFLAFAMTLGAAAVLHPADIQVKSPADMAMILTPTVGSWATVVFALGLWAAAFSSLAGNSTIGGSMLAAAFGREKDGVNATFTKVCISIVIVLGGVVATLFGGIPVQLILTAQATTIVVVPLIGAMMLILARSKDRGSLRVPMWELVVGSVGLLFLCWLAYTYLGKFI